MTTNQVALKNKVRQMKTLVIHNPRSGKLKAMESHGDIIPKGDSVKQVALEPSIDLPDLFQKEVEEGTELIIAAGGDGTVNAVANALMGLAADRRPAMGIIPLGTANDFAWTLRLPDDPHEAWDLTQTGITRNVDVIEMTTREQQVHFVNLAAGGNSVKVTESITDELKQQWGPLVYVRGAVEAISQLESYQTKILVDDSTTIERSVWSVLVANGMTNAGRLLVAPDASPFDGLVDLILIEDGSLLDLADVSANLMLGNYLEHPLVNLVKAKSLTIESTPPMRFTVDGEIVDQEPVRFRVIKGAIRMVVGATHD